MEYSRYRCHPRVHSKKSPEEEKSLELSAAAAVGILTLVFAKGIFWGYMIKKRIG